MRTLIIALPLLLLAAPALAETPDNEPTLQGENAATEITAPEAMVDAAGSDLRPAMHEEIRTQREQEQAAMAELLAELQQATSPEARDEIQQRIMETKADGQLAVMNIQLKYARLGGFEEQATRLVAEIETFEERRDAPRAPIVPATERRDRIEQKGTN